MDKAIKLADTDIFRQTFDAYYQPIRNFLYYRLGDMDLAEDLAQEVFLKLWEKREVLQIQAIKSYLYKMAVNLSVNHLKHQKVVLNFVNQTQPKLAVESQNPEYQLEYQEFGTQLNDAISSLSEKQRSVFLMNRIDKLTYNEIAERLNISVKAVEKRMNKALQYLRASISPLI